VHTPKSTPPSANPVAGPHINRAVGSLLEEAKTLAHHFADVSAESFETTAAFDRRRHEFFAKCYSLAIRFENDRPEFERLKSDPFWEGISRQRPKDKYFVKWVLYYTMRAVTDNVRGLAGKAAKVLKSFMRDGIDPGDVADRLDAGGGVYPIHDHLCAKERAIKELGDGIDSGLSEIRQIIEEEAEADVEEPVEPPEELFTDKTAKSGAFAHRMNSHFRALRKNERNDRSSGEVRKRIPLNRIDLNEILAVSTNRFNIDRIRGTKLVTICAVVEQIDERGWNVVRAEHVITSDGVSKRFPGTELLYDPPDYEDDLDEVVQRFHDERASSSQ
jgi:hypothetical protein